MNFRLIFTVTVILFTIGCNAETNNVLLERSNNPAIESLSQAEKAMNSFSSAVVKKDTNLFLSIAEPKGLYLVRSFTSGNLGGRGASLSEKIVPTTINKDLAFPIKSQTPFDLSSLFTSLPIKSFKALPTRMLLSEVETTPYDQRAPILKKTLKGASEVIEGDPILLISSSPKYWVYAEAQIIDDILVGGFAIFETKNDMLKLVAVIELL